MKTRSWILMLVTALLFVACGDSEPEEPVTFGQGEIPATVPSDFPLPPRSPIGSTLVDRINDRTEFALNAPLSLEDTIDFFVVELADAGYAVTSSEDIGTLWEIAFERGDLEGRIRIQGMNPQTTQVVVSMNRS